MHTHPPAPCAPPRLSLCPLAPWHSFDHSTRRCTHAASTVVRGSSMMNDQKKPLQVHFLYECFSVFKTNYEVNFHSAYLIRVLLCFFKIPPTNRKHRQKSGFFQNDRPPATKHGSCAANLQSLMAHILVTTREISNSLDQMHLFRTVITMMGQTPDSFEQFFRSQIAKTGI